MTIFLHVSPSGSDLNPGTREAPLQSLHAARERMRQLLADRPRGAEGDIVVTLAPGRHILAETLVLGPEDGGDGSFEVIWEGSTEAGTLLSSGLPVGTWTRCGDSDPDIPQGLRGRVWFAQLAAGTDVNTLYGSGGSLPRARGPAIQPLRIPRPEAAERFGTDTESLAEDPGFIDVQNGDFRLKPDAAAHRIGFQPLPLERMFAAERGTHG